MTNFYQSLAEAFSKRPDAPALILKDRPDWSYGDLIDQVNHLAQVLLANEVEPGDRVMVQVDKSPENLALYLATLKVGGVYVPLNTAYTEAELDYFVTDAQPQLFVGAEQRAGVNCLTLNEQRPKALQMPMNAKQSVEGSKILPLSSTPRVLLGALRALC